MLNSAEHEICGISRFSVIRPLSQKIQEHERVSIIKKSSHQVTWANNLFAVFYAVQEPE